MDDTPTNLLVAECDDRLRELLVDQFLADRFAAHGARSAEEARVKIANFHPHVLVLGELEQPLYQLSLLRGIRSGGDQALLVIVLSPDVGELAELGAFNQGCDDYLRKPISYPGLLARVRARVKQLDRRGHRQRIGALEVDQPQRRVAVAQRPVQLSRMEFELLSHLAVEPTRVCSKEELLRKVWGFKAMGNTRTVRRPRLPAAQEASPRRRAAPDPAVAQRPCGVAGGRGCAGVRGSGGELRSGERGRCGRPVSARPRRPSGRRWRARRASSAAVGRSIRRT